MESTVLVVELETALRAPREDGQMACAGKKHPRHSGKSLKTADRQTAMATQSKTRRVPEEREQLQVQTLSDWLEREELGRRAAQLQEQGILVAEQRVIHWD